MTSAFDSEKLESESSEYGWLKLSDGREVFRRISGREEHSRSNLPCPMVISDYLPNGGLEHPCTGEIIDSKSRFEKTTRAHGCETIGNDPARLRPRPRPLPDRQKIRDSIKVGFAKAAAGVRA